MQPEIIIRDESAADVGTIHDVTAAAFETMAFSSHTEQYIVAGLRTAEALMLSLVAECDGRVVGHIAFSPVTISDGSQGWYGLGPVSVLPGYQRQGIGKALVKEGLARLERMGAHGCCLVGHPDYYRQFGFRSTSNLVYEGAPPEYFFALPFANQTPQGNITFHEAFLADQPSGDSV